MVNYKDGKIYKLVGGGLTYIGSTTQRLSKRKYQHKQLKNCSSRQLVDCDDFDIILIENFPCESKEELHARERYYIENTECINMIIPIRTNQEKKDRTQKYYASNQELILQKRRNYRANNKDKIKEQKKAYYESHKKQVAEYFQKNKAKIYERRKIYREKNREKIRQRMREYRLRKKEEKERENLK